MESHVKVLGILHLAFGALGVLGALVLLLLFGGLAGLIGASASGEDAHLAIPILSGLGSFLFFLLLALSLPGLIAGVGLLQFRPWARVLTIILSVFDLVSVPFGTALGIYGLWVLLSQGTERLFQPTGQSYP
jgi:hypothetical protein